MSLFDAFCRLATVSVATSFFYVSTFAASVRADWSVEQHFSGSSNRALEGQVNFEGLSQQTLNENFLIDGGLNAPCASTGCGGVNLDTVTLQSVSNQNVSNSYDGRFDFRQDDTYNTTGAFNAEGSCLACIPDAAPAFSPIQQSTTYVVPLNIPQGTFPRVSSGFQSVFEYQSVFE